MNANGLANAAFCPHIHGNRLKAVRIRTRHMRKLIAVTAAPPGHWVGDGFPVRTLFSHHSHGHHVSPFLMLDHAGPAHFEPTTQRRGVGVHPHRGFETVTIVYDGGVDHLDSAGHGGHIGPGDVQWMTAASGVLHQEYHSDDFARAGGRFEMAQLWVNLPARDKMSPPRYQTLLDKQIPEVALPDGAGKLRVIAGDFNGAKGPARTFTPLDIWDVRLVAGKSAVLTLPEGHTLTLAVLDGAVKLNGEAMAQAPQVAAFEREGGEIALAAQSDAKLLVLSGAPIDEPVAWHGPFVMNTNDELRQAIRDFQTGRFGEMPA